MDSYGTLLETGSEVGRTANERPRVLGTEVSRVHYPRASSTEGGYASEMTGGLGGLLNAAQLLVRSEESNDSSTSDSGVADSGSIMSAGSTNMESTRFFDTESADKLDCGEAAGERLEHTLYGLMGSACAFIDTLRPLCADQRCMYSSLSRLIMSSSCDL